MIGRVPAPPNKIPDHSLLASSFTYSLLSAFVGFAMAVPVSMAVCVTVLITVCVGQESGLLDFPVNTRLH